MEFKNGNRLKMSKRNELQIGVDELKVTPSYEEFSKKIESLIKQSPEDFEKKMIELGYSKHKESKNMD